MISFFLVFSGAIAQSTDDSLPQIRLHTSTAQKVSLYLEIAQKNTADSAESNSYIRKAYQLAKENHMIQEQATSLYFLGQNYYNSFDYITAIEWYKKALQLYESIPDKKNIANCYRLIGQCHFSLYQNEMAIDQFIKGLKFSENDKEGTAKLLSSLALTHLRMRNLITSAANYREALAINKSIDNQAGIAANYNGLGMVFHSMNRLDSALLYYYRAHMLFKKQKRKDNMALTLNNIAGIYLNFPDSINKSIQYYSDAWDIFEEIGWKHREAEIRQGIGSALYKQGKYHKAIENYLISNEVNDKYKQGYLHKTTNYNLLSMAYEKLNDYKTALTYRKLYEQFSDSLHQKEKYEKLIALEKKYDLQKKENEIIKLEAKQKLTNFELKKNQQLKQLGFVTALILLLFAFFILKKYAEKNKSNRLLEEKNEIIEKSEKELRILNAAQNKFFSIIAHDLKNPFHTILGYSELLSKEYDHFTDEERKKFAADINQSTNNIFRLLQNLLDWARSQTGRLIFTPTDLEFNQVHSKAISVMAPLARQKNIEINTSFDENLRIFADAVMIETVIRNLINNAIKFTPENGSIEISAVQQNGNVQVCVRDNGIGINDADVQNLFRIDSKVKRKGTNNEDGTGLGLILCKEFIEKNGGEIWAERNQDRGSSFLFTVPAPSLS